MVTKGLHKSMLFYGLSILILFLSGCQAAGIHTAVTLSEEIETENATDLDDRVSSYFERESYTVEEMDEMFYIIENNLEAPVEVSEFYFVQKWADTEWKTLDNNTINQIDRTVTVSPGESAEFVFWLSTGSDELDGGTYRLTTKVTIIDETEEDESGEHVNLFIPFEINQ